MSIFYFEGEVKIDKEVNVMITCDKMSSQGESMCPADFKESLSILRLTIPEISKLLGVNNRTTQRWLSGETDIPLAIESVLKAWLLLNNFGLPWRPDGYSISLINEYEFRTQIMQSNQHSILLETILQNVENRGGPAAPWTVDLMQKKATLGDIWVSFYMLPNGSFTPQSYGRFDKSPDVSRDKLILEDAYACIAQAIESQMKSDREADWSSVTI